MYLGNLNTEEPELFSRLRGIFGKLMIEILGTREQRHYTGILHLQTWYTQIRYTTMAAYRLGGNLKIQILLSFAIGIAGTFSSIVFEFRCTKGGDHEDSRGKPQLSCARECAVSYKCASFTTNATDCVWNSNGTRFVKIGNGNRRKTTENVETEDEQKENSKAEIEKQRKREPARNRGGRIDLTETGKCFKLQHVKMNGFDPEQSPFKCWSCIRECKRKNRSNGPSCPQMAGKFYTLKNKAFSRDLKSCLIFEFLKRLQVSVGMFADRCPVTRETRHFNRDHRDEPCTFFPPLVTDENGIANVRCGLDASQVKVLLVQCPEC